METNKYKELKRMLEQRANNPGGEVTCASCGSTTSEWGFLWGVAYCGSCANQIFQEND